MHIGVDATCWQNGRGYGRHARSLLGALVRLDSANRYTLFMDSTENCDSLPAEAEVRLVRTRAPTAVAAASNGHRSYVDLLRMSRAMSGEELDVLLFPTVYSYVPVFSRAKKIVIIHDIIAEKYPQLTLPTAASRFFWRAKAALARWQADAIATVSDYSREGILRHFGLAPDRVFVVSEASDPIFRVLERAEPTERLCSHGITAGQRLITYLGGFSPHKNLETLVAVFADLASRKEFSDVRLVMAGETEREVFHNYFQEIKAQVEKLDVSDRVIFTGYLRDEEIVTLLNLSTVLVLPSLIEGFGLPAIEAAACGCPVIATSASPLPGLLGEAAIFIDPLKSKELATALDRVLTSAELRCRMREGGTAAARRLTWEAAAQQMSDLIKHVVAQ